jgi:hypothetical protein
MRCNIVKSQKIENEHKNCTWATGRNAVLIHTANQNIMITREEFEIDGNWSSIEDRYLDFNEKDRTQLLKGFMQCLEDENDEEILNIINGYKDTNFGLDILQTMVAFIEKLMNNYKFDKAINLIKYIEN